MNVSGNKYAGFKSHKVTRVQEAEGWSLLNLVEGVNEQDLGSNLPYSLDKCTPARMVMHRQKLRCSLICREREQIRQ